MLCHVQFSNTLLDIPASQVFHVRAGFSVARGAAAPNLALLLPSLFGRRFLTGLHLRRTVWPGVELGNLCQAAFPGRPSSNAPHIPVTPRALLLSCVFFFAGPCHPWAFYPQQAAVSERLLLT